MPITKRLIDKLKYDPDGPKQQVLWDRDTGEGVPGFGVRVYESGVKSFVLAYRTQTGRARIMTLGRYGDLTVDSARVRARKERVRVTDGEDPAADRRAARNAATVKELGETYLERWAKKEKKTWREDKRRIDNYIVPELGHLGLKAVKRADVSALHHKVGLRGRYEANRVLALISTMFTQAEEWGYLPEGNRNPARGATPYKEKRRDRWVKPAEMPRLMEAIADADNVYVRALILMYLLTGCRKGELLPRRWDEVDTDRRDLRLPDTKDGEPHIVPLSSAAWQVIEGIPKQAGNPFIFCGHKRGSHLVNIAKPWGRIRTAAGVEDVRIHDLRRSVGSWLANSGASLQLIGKVLNHADVATTKVYAHLLDDAARQALEEHGKRIMGLNTD